MKVSVIMPVFSKAPFLQEALDSLLQGSFTDLELIAVDDASTDGSLAILEAQQDPRVKVVRHERNQGPAAAAQTAIDHAQGEYLIRQDADDIAMPGRIKGQVAFMDANPDVAASGGHLQLFGAEDALWRFPTCPQACRPRAVFDTPISQGTSIMRKKVLDLYNVRYDPAWPRIGEDRLFFTRLSEVAQLANIDKPLIKYRRGEHNSTHGRDANADIKEVNRQVFGMLGIDATERELELHGYFKGRLPMQLRNEDAKELHDWKMNLTEQVRALGTMPMLAFEADLQERWDRVFHLAVDHGPGPALSIMRSSGWPVRNMIYFAKANIKKMLRSGSAK